MRRRARAVLGTASATHFVHDGFSDIIYVLLPIWSVEFGLSFAQVGLLRTWATGNTRLLTEAPAARTLVVRTEDLDGTGPRLAAAKRDLTQAGEPFGAKSRRRILEKR